jgi:CO/xanthine dehydrogenase FAD-binding subunit
MEFARRSGDYALVGAAAVVTPSLDDHCMSVHIAYLGIAGLPLRVREIENMLIDTTLDEKVLDEASELARTFVGEDMEDVHATVDYRRALTAEITRRVLRMAWARREH